MIQFNGNFDNEYFALIDSANKEQVRYFLKTIFDLNPELSKDVNMQIINKGSEHIEIQFHNTSAFDYLTKCEVFKYLNSIREFNPLR